MAVLIARSAFICILFFHLAHVRILYAIMILCKFLASYGAEDIITGVFSLYVWSFTKGTKWLSV